MIATTRATVWAGTALLLAAIATACGTSAPITPPTAGASAAPAEVAAAVGADGLSARSVVDALAQVHPAPNARDNSRNCVSEQGMGCAGLVTTDLISVYAWSDEAGATHQAEVFGADQADQVGRFVLSYSGRRGDEVVPDDIRADWESAARRLVADAG